MRGRAGLRGILRERDRIQAADVLSALRSAGERDGAERSGRRGATTERSTGAAIATTSRGAESVGSGGRGGRAGEKRISLSNAAQECAQEAPERSSGRIAALRSRGEVESHGTGDRCRSRDVTLMS